MIVSSLNHWACKQAFDVQKDEELTEVRKAFVTFLKIAGRGGEKEGRK